MKKTLRSFAKFIGLLFLLPCLISLGAWAFKDRPSSWHEADWSSSGVLHSGAHGKVDEDVIHIMGARTGGIKGALSIHTWIVTRRKGEPYYDRYDKVGWGNPVRQNAYAADARWYSNEPFFIKSITGEKASLVMDKVETAIANYPYNYRGGYGLWPGPNSNSFIAHVLNEVPELDVALPALAVGRSFLGQGRLVFWDEGRQNLQVGWRGLVGFAAGRRHGFVLHFMGLTAGVDILNPAVKLPGIGRIGFGEVKAFAATLF